MLFVLVVEDDPDLRELTAELLTDAGHRVMTAPGGHEALEIMRALRPALVIMDLMMPGLDGWSLAATMASDPDLGTVPFCVLSATTTEPVPAGAVQVFQKPVNAGALLALVARYTRAT